MNNLAWCHEEGCGVDQSYAEARRLYDLAVKNGCRGQWSPSEREQAALRAAEQE